VDGVARVAREILAHAPADAQVKLTLDVEIRGEAGFIPASESTIRENARALRFEQEALEDG
jgi:hypothetical protein